MMTESLSPKKAELLAEMPENFVQAAITPRGVAELLAHTARSDPGPGEHANNARKHPQVSQQQMVDLMDVVLRTLSDRERAVLEMRFGLADGGSGCTLDETALKFEVSRERIRQIEAKALQTLRRSNQPPNYDVIKAIH